MAFFGVVIAKNATSLTVVPETPSYSPQPIATGAAGVAPTLPATLTVTLNSQTLVDSPHGFADLVPGTVIVAGGAFLAPATFAAQMVTAITAPKAAAPPAAVARAPMPNRPVMRSIGVGLGKKRAQSSALAPEASNEITFSTQPATQPVGAPGGPPANFSYPRSFNGCTKFVVNGIIGPVNDVHYDWPFVVVAGEAAPLVISQQGIVEYQALGVAQTSPSNVYVKAGFIIDAQVGIVSCTGISYTVGIPIPAEAAQIELSASIPGQLGSNPLTIYSEGTTFGVPIGSPDTSGSCAALGFEFPKELIGKYGKALPNLDFAVIACPVVTFTNGVINLQNMTVTGGTGMPLQNVALGPTGAMSITPNNPTSFTMSPTLTQYTYTQTNGVRFGSSILGVPLLISSVKSFAPQPVTLYGSPNSVSWTLPATAAPAAPPRTPVTASQIFVSTGGDCGSGGDTISTYPANVSGLIKSPVGTITGGNTRLNCPFSLAVDAAGRIYAGTSNGNSITVYAPNPVRILNEIPLAVIVGPSTRS